MDLLTPETREQLLANGRLTAEGVNHDPFPVVKIFTPDAAATWLLSELDPNNPDIAFGLCDLGLGMPELGTVSLTELSKLRGKLGLPVERDLGFHAERPLSHYAQEARKAGIVRA